jgi:glycosyltransferase involved in cell wall biosynthesis/putative flippase GtrA
MRIAVVTETWAPSVDGVVVRLENTVRELRADGHEIMVVAPTVGTRLTGVQEYRTRNIRLGFLYGGHPWGLPDWSVLPALEEFDPDVVHVVNPVLMAALAAWLVRSRYPVVASYHTDVVAYAGHYHLGWLKGPVKSMMRRTYRRAAVRMATSELGRRRLAEAGIGEVELWSRGVDRETFRPDRDGSAMRARLSPDPDVPLVLYVGRLATEKGCERLLPLLGCDPPVHVAFVGDGPDRERLQRLFGQEQVTFTGLLCGEEVADAYAAADVFVFPSDTDTLGLVLLEAMACGVPVVAADTEAARETLAGYPKHVLVDGSDDHEMVGCVEKALGMSPSGQQRLSHSQASWRGATDDLLGAYQEARYKARAQAPGHATRISRFAAVAVMNAGVDLAVFNLLLLLLDPSPSPALLVAFTTCAVIAGITNSYIWNSRWTFRDRRRGGVGGQRRQRFLFALQAGVNVAVNNVTVLGLSLLTSWFGLGSALAANGAKVVGMFAASAVSYLLMHRFVFDNEPTTTMHSTTEHAAEDADLNPGRRHDTPVGR